MSNLAQEIATRIYNQTHDRIPAYCEEMGIPLPSNLAGSKREKADQIVSPLAERELADIALTVARKTQDIPLDEMGREVLERDGPKLHKVTRRDIAECFDKFGGLQGSANIVEIVAKFWPLENQFDQLDALFGGKGGQSLKDQIYRHMVQHPEDWDVDQLFEHIQAYGWSNARFFALMEEGLRPLSRRGDEQTNLADALNAILKRDGFKLDVVGHESTFPTYNVVRLNQGVAGSAKNLIFASIGKKPVLGFSDAINNTIVVLENEKSCLIYERPLPPQGLLWDELVDWWKGRSQGLSDEEARNGLGERLKQSLATPSEAELFKRYFQIFKPRMQQSLPALIPQVYLHYDPAVVKTLRDRESFTYQRMDFLLLLPGKVRVVLELDGTHHFVEKDKPSLSKYASMVAADRDLRLLGYEVYRFGSNELEGPDSEQVIKEFFERLFKKHGVL